MKKYSALLLTIIMVAGCSSTPREPRTENPELNMSPLGSYTWRTDRSHAFNISRMAGLDMLHDRSDVTNVTNEITGANYYGGAAMEFIGGGILSGVADISTSNQMNRASRDWRPHVLTSVSPAELADFEPEHAFHIFRDKIGLSVFNAIKAEYPSAELVGVYTNTQYGIDGNPFLILVNHPVCERQQEIGVFQPSCPKSLF